MPRSLTAAFQADLEASRASDIVLYFLTFNHETWELPLRIVNDLVDYTKDGVIWTGFPFLLTILTDDDRPPRGQIKVQNVDRRLGALIQQLVFAPMMQVEIYAGSGWNTAIDGGSNSRLPIGTPTREYRAKNLQLREVTTITADVSLTFGPPDITQEMWPAPRATKQITPALYR